MLPPIRILADIEYGTNSRLQRQLYDVAAKIDTTVVQLCRKESFGLSEP